jgi:hypothetical protein
MEDLITICLTSDTTGNNEPGRYKIIIEAGSENEKILSIFQEIQNNAFTGALPGNSRCGV